MMTQKHAGNESEASSSTIFKSKSSSFSLMPGQHDSSSSSTVAASLPTNRASFGKTIEAIEGYMEAIENSTGEMGNCIDKMQSFYDTMYKDSIDEMTTPNEENRSLFDSVNEKITQSNQG